MQIKIRKFFIDLANLGIVYNYDKSLYVQIRLSNIISSFLGLLIIIYAVIFYFFRLTIPSFLCVLISLIYIAMPIFNRSGFINLTRVLMIIIGNLVILSFSILLGKVSLVHLFFILMIASPFFFFNFGEKLKMFSSLAFCALTLICYELYNYYIGYIPYSLSGETAYILRISVFFTIVFFQAIIIYFFSQGNFKLQQAFNDSSKKLKDTMAQLVQAEKITALGDLSAGVAHELNQPLNVIKIICQSIIKDIKKDRFDRESASEDLPEIMDQVNRMADIISHMRNYSMRSHSGSLSQINVTSLLYDSFKLVERQLLNHGIKLVKEFEPGLPPIMGNPNKLEQAFINLISNARHAVEGSGKEEKLVKIKCSLSDEGDSIALIFIDNGGGISPEHIDKVFDPFFTTREPGRGTGLGLTVVKNIIEEHRGRIKVESNPGEGSFFIVELPLSQA